MRSKLYEADLFVGELKGLLADFVEMKRSLGLQFTTQAEILQRFSRFTLTYPVQNQILSKELVDAWAQKRPQEQDTTWEHRVNTLRQFAIYLNHLGNDVYIPHCRRKIHRNLYVPYIFTLDQLRQFFIACDQLPRHPLSNRCFVLPALFRLLYSCGLRISEAIALQREDVDLQQGTITIRGAKFDKDRLIPMSPSLTAYLQDYELKMPVIPTLSNHFFTKKDQTPLNDNTVYKNFRMLLWKSGISHGGKGIGPRLHDFRHTFAVHALNQLVQQGVDLYCALPILSTYLGHASVAATERYVRLTEEAYPGLLTTVSQTCAYVFPEVTGR